MAELGDCKLEIADCKLQIGGRQHHTFFSANRVLISTDRNRTDLLPSCGFANRVQPKAGCYASGTSSRYTPSSRNTD